MALSTHVLDTVHGCPAAGMAVELYAMHDANASLIKRFVLDANGRHPGGPVLDACAKGTYRLVFAVADYFRSRGVVLAQPAFLDRVNIDFGIAEPAQHYHVPLLASPWSYSTYRGS